MLSVAQLPLPSTHPASLELELFDAGPVLDPDYGVMDFSESLRMFRMSHSDDKDFLQELQRYDAGVRVKCILCDRKISSEALCPSCGQGLYCSTHCRDEDKPFHRHVCGCIDRMPDETRPSKHHARVVYFPPSRDHPEIIWVKFAFDRMAGKLRLHFTSDQEDIAVWIGEHAQPGTTAQAWVAPMAWKGYGLSRKFGHGLALCGAARATGNKASDLNRCLMHLAKPGQLLPRFGIEFLFAYFTTPGGAFVGVADVDLRDLQHAVDLYVTHPQNSIIPSPQRTGLQHVQGIKYNLVDHPLNQALGVTKPSETVTACGCEWGFGLAAKGLALAQPFELGLRWIVRLGSLEDMAECMDESLDPKSWTDDLLLLRALGPALQPGEDFSVDPETGEVAGELVCASPVTRLHSAVVHHAYRSGLHPAHVSALISFVGMLNAPETSDEVREGADFSAYWETWKEEQVDKGNLIQHVASPYTLEEELPAGRVPHPVVEEAIKRLATKRIESGQTRVFR